MESSYVDLADAGTWSSTTCAACATSSRRSARGASSTSAARAARCRGRWRPATPSAASWWPRSTATCSRWPRSHLGLRRAPGLRVRHADGRALLAAEGDASADAILIDAFVGARVPRHLATLEALRDAARVLAPRGALAINVVDAAPLPDARAIAAGLREVFADGRGDRRAARAARPARRQRRAARRARLAAARAPARPRRGRSLPRRAAGPGPRGALLRGSLGLDGLARGALRRRGCADACTDRPHSRPLDDPAELGALVRALRRARPRGPRPRLARLRRRRPGPERRPVAGRGPRHRADPRPLRVHHPRPRRAADHHGPLVRRPVHHDPARPRPRRGRRVGRRRARQGHPRPADLHAALVVPRPGQPANRGKATALTHDQFHYAFTNTISEADSRAAYERYAVPAAEPGAVRGRGGELQPAHGGEGRLRERRTARRCCCWPAARTTSCPPRRRTRSPRSTRSPAP